MRTVEIGSFLRLTPRRLAALVVVAAIGAVGGLSVAAKAPAETTTSATIRVGDIFSPTGNNFEINPFALGVVGVLREGPVQERIAKVAKVDQTLVDTLEASQPDEGGPVLLSVVGTDDDESAAVIEAAAKVGLDVYSERQVARALARKSTTQADLDEATASLLAWEADTGYGYGLPDIINRFQLQALPEAKAAINDPGLTTNEATARVTELEAALDRARLLLPALAPLAQEYDRTVAKDGEVSGALLAAEDARSVIEADVDSYIVDGGSTPVPRTPGLIRGAIGGGVALAGLLMAAFLARAVILERRRLVRRAERRETSPDDDDVELATDDDDQLAEHDAAEIEAEGGGRAAARSSKKASSSKSRSRAGAKRSRSRRGSSSRSDDASADESVDTSSASAKNGAPVAADGDDSEGADDDSEKIPAGVSSAASPSPKTPPRRPSKTTESRQTGRGSAGSRRATRKP